MNKVPVVPTVEQVENDDFTIPLLNDRVPDGWERTDDPEWFVDHSGWGQPGEAALTFAQFKTALLVYVRHNPTHGYGITDVGQFQLFVAAFRPVEADEPVIVHQ